MISPFARRFALVAALALAAAVAPRASAQAARYSSESAAMGPGGFVMNFCVLWTCDDDPRGTTSAPGRIDLVDAGGSLVGQLLATASGGRASVTVSGAGATSNLSASIHLYGADGTPADGIVSGTWTLPDLGPGLYTFRFWFSQSSVARNPASTISTDTLNAGGGGPVGGAPAPPPEVTVLAPATATAFQRVGIGAAASVPPSRRERSGACRRWAVIRR